MLKFMLSIILLQTDGQTENVLMAAIQSRQQASADAHC